jgi:hypothetical protein
VLVLVQELEAGFSWVGGGLAREVVSWEYGVRRNYRGVEGEQHNLVAARGS